MKIDNTKTKIHTQINIENNHAPIHLSGGNDPEKGEAEAWDAAELRQMVALDKIKEVLDILVQKQPDNNDFIFQKGRFAKNENDGRLGIISNDEYNRERNKIRLAILEML